LRPVQLGIKAFGPFFEGSKIDFRALQAAPVFLIHGPIGAGKTTLLDGLMFALYGSSSGGERTAMDLRSDLADDQNPTEVVLDFAHGASQFRIRRTIVGERLQAQVWNLTGFDWRDPFETPNLTPLDGSQNWQGATQIIQNLLGLNELEFRRSVLIPQGQFRQFLCCEAEERAGILGALFQVQPHRNVIEPLQKSVDSRIAELNVHWNRREQLSGSSSDGIILSRHDKMEAFRRRLQEIDTEQTRLSQAQGKVVQQVTRAAVLEERSQELDLARQSLLQSEERHQRLERQSKNLERYKSAKTLEPYRIQLAQARTDFATSKRELQALELLDDAAHDSEDTTSTKAIKDLQELKKLQTELRQELKDLEKSELLLVEVGILEDEIRSHHQVQDEIARQLADVQLSEHQAVVRLEELGHSRELNPGRDRMQIIRLQLQQHQGGQKRGRQRAELESSLLRLRTYQERAESRCAEMLVRIESLKTEIELGRGQAWNEQACKLAEMLQPGQPCLVCGSPHHPQPATSSPVEIKNQPIRGLSGRPREGQLMGKRLEHKQAQLKQAELLAQKLNREREDQALMIARLESRLESLQEDSEQSIDLSSTTATVRAGSGTLSESELSALQDELSLLERSLQKRASTEGERSRIEQSLHRLQSNRQELERRQREADTTRVRFETLLGEKRRMLTEEMCNSSEAKLRIEQKRLKLSQDLEAVEHDLQSGEGVVVQSANELAARKAAKLAAERSKKMAEDRVRMAEEIYLARSQASGFDSIEQAEENLEMKSSEQSSASPEVLDIEIKSAQQDLAVAQERLERAESLYQSSIEEFGPNQSQEELGERLEELTFQRSAALSEIELLRKQEQDYQACIDSIQRLEDEIASLKKLLRVSNGDNPLKLSFADFCFSERMQNVIFSANQRLAPMTRGRYQLRQVKHRLELEVRDELNGQSRPIATLSGGEMFLASLALALGLTDAQPSGSPVQALETLFIDEGFGNLDEDALELAMEGIFQLRQEGRLIGIVSHLAELRDQIPARIEVLNSPLGSKIAVHAS
jgi:DNA repair protein SbcC/Rad50